MTTLGRKLPILLFLLFVTSCGSNAVRNTAQNSKTSPGGTSNSNAAANDNVEMLESTIRIPFHPQDAIWREEPAAGPDKPRRIIAIIKFGADDAKKVSEMSSKGTPGSPFEIESEDWFPPELVAKSQESGNETIKGVSYPATEFTQAPFNEGRVSRIEGTDFFVVELFAR